METTETTRVVAKSEAVGRTASALMPGGTASAFEAWYDRADPAATLMTLFGKGGPGGPPPVITKGKGATLTDLDGNEYIDYICGQGSLILGHADERVTAAISKAASKGSGFGAPSDVQVRLAELIASRNLSIDMLRLVDTPTDALVSALELAREVTGRDRIVTFEGFVHGGVVEMAYGATVGGKAGSSPALPYNDSRAAEILFREHGPSIAAVVVEPIAVGIGLVPPADGFLDTLRRSCDEHGALLIFDEVVTGFRIAPGGAATLCDVASDLTLLGPIIGGGLPLASFGGRKEVMKRFETLGSQHVGPASGNVLGMAAGIATLQAVGEPGFYEELTTRSTRLDEGLRTAAAAASVATCHERVASLLAMFFCDKPVRDATSARHCNVATFARYHRAMLDRGVLLPPSPLACLSISAAHTDEQIDRTIEAAHEALRIAGTADG